MKRTFFAILYYVLFARLPSSKFPIIGNISKYFRYICAKNMFKKCGKNVNIERGAYIGKGAKIEIGDNSGIGINARIIGPVEIGNNVMMSPNVMVIANKHGYKNRKIPIMKQGIFEEKIEIGDDVWIGAGAIILPGLKIASGCVIGAGSVVTKSFGDNLVIAGNPAKIIKRR